MGTLALTVSRTATDVPINLSVESGTSGLTVVAAVRDSASLVSYLDFDDQTFKAAGWVSRTVALTDLVATAGAGFYAAPPGSLNLSTITNLPAATDSLVVEFVITGAVVAVAEDLILLQQPATAAPELLDVWRIMGLDATSPLVVSDQNRRAGAVINQTIAIAGGVVTVTRL